MRVTVRAICGQIGLEAALERRLAGAKDTLSILEDDGSEVALIAKGARRARISP